MRPLFTGFRSTNVWNAFTLNAIVIMLSTLMAIEAKSFFTKEELSVTPEGKVVSRTTWKSVLAILIITFATAFVSYTIMYFLFAFGGGMLINGASSVVN